jgi:hypothetical protein
MTKLAGLEIGFDVSAVMRQAIEPNTWREISDLAAFHAQSDLRSAESAKILEKVMADNAASGMQPPKHRGILDKCTELEQARIAKRKDAAWKWENHDASTRGFIRERLFSKLNLEFPSVLEMGEAVNDFVRFRDYLQDRMQLPVPDETTPPEPEDLVVFLMSEAKRGIAHVEKLRINISKVLYAQGHRDVASDPAVQKLIEFLRAKEAKENDDGNV